MKPVSFRSTRAISIGLAMVLAFAGAARAQDPQASPSPLDEKARQRAERDAKKAAETEEKAARSAAERERKEAEAAARERDRAAARQSATEQQSTASTATQATGEALTREQERIQKAEEKARAEADKARKKEEDRMRAQEAKDAERRRKDEERAEREALKAREKEDRDRAIALKRDQEAADKEAKRAPAAGDPEPAVSRPTPPVPLVESAPVSKDEERRRKDLVKQIEKARAERDKLNQEADAAESLARTSRNAANEAQRTYEALTTGLAVEEVVLPQAAVPEAAPKKNRFMTRADEKQAAAAKNAATDAPDPLRIALDLKNANAEDRERAAFALASLGPEALPAARSLMAALADSNAAVRVAAAQALGRIGPGAVSAIAPLSAALTDPDPSVKSAAQAALLAIQGR